MVESTTPERASVRVVSGSVEEGERARMAGYRFPAAPLRVNVGEVGTATTEALSRAVQEARSVQLVENPDAFSHLLLRRGGDSVRVVGLDGATRERFAAGQAGADALAGHLRKEAAAKQLGDIENPAQDFGVEVWLEEGQRTLGLGQSVTFHARAERDGYLTLVDLGTDGQVTVLYPNPYEDDNRVREGETYTFPTAEMDFEIQVQPPPGRGMVRAFLTEEPLDLPSGSDFTSGDVLLAERIAGAVKEVAGPVEGSSEAIRLDSWGTAAMVYEIEP